MRYNDKVITMENGDKYIVIYQIDYEGNTYLYLVNRDKNADTMFVQIRNNKVSYIEPKLFKEKIFPLFINALQDD